MNRPRLGFSHAVRPEGEDCFALVENAASAALCVADGCGGSGGRRYAGCGGHTGAYLASRLAAQVFQAFAGAPERFPGTAEEAEALRDEWERRLDTAFQSFAASRGMLQSSRIVGSLQRVLPTTLCGAFTRRAAEGLDVCFLWAGDSRGYVLDADGLHQCTRDHLRGQPDAYESLWMDAPLSRCICAEQETRLSLRRLTLSRPSLVLLATDGVYGALPTPMELEERLLDALMHAVSWDSLSQTLEAVFSPLAQDDATLVLQPWGIERFAQLGTMLEKRRRELEAAYLTPLRGRRGDREAGRALWERYRQAYDWTECDEHGGVD